MFSQISQFYLIDWLAMVCTFISLYALGSNKRYGFLMGASSNIMWFGIGVASEMVSITVSGAVFCILNIRAYVQWQHRQGTQPQG